MSYWHICYWRMGYWRHYNCYVNCSQVPLWSQVPLYPNFNFNLNFNFNRPPYIQSMI
jgi:hypothetical protein